MRRQSPRIIISIAATILLAAVCTFARQSTSETFQRARLLDEGNQKLTEAIKLYAQVVSQAENDRVLAAKAQYRIAVLYKRLGRRAEALKAFKAVVTQFPDQTDVARRALARIPPTSTEENKGPARPRLSHPRQLSEQESSNSYRQWLNQHPEIIRDYGAPTIAKFVNAHEQQFQRGTIIYNVTDEWSVILFTRGDAGGVFKRLPNPKDLTPGVGEVDEAVFAEVTSEMTKEQRQFYRSLVDSRVTSPDRRTVGIIGGIASLYILNKAYDDLGLPLENEKFIADVVYASAKGYEVLAGLRHSVGEPRPLQPKSVYVLYPDNTYRRHITFPSNNGRAGSPASPQVMPRSLTAFDVADDTPPTITCPPNITWSPAPGECSAVVSFTVTATDKHPGVTVVSSRASGSVFPKGTTTVTSTATDVAGNTATCTFTVTVRDTSLKTETVAYVTNQDSNSVSVIDTASNTVVATIPMAPPQGVAITPNGAFAYVTNYLADTVSVIDTATNTVASTIRVGAEPVFLAITPDGAHVYIGNAGSPSTVSVIDTATNTVVATIPVGAAPYHIAITPDGRRAYVANYLADLVSVIDTTTNTVVARIPMGSESRPSGIAITANGARVYVTNSAGAVGVIGTRTNTVLAIIPVGYCPAVVAITPDGTRAYVTQSRSDSVTVIDTASNKVVATVAVGSAPYGAAITPDGSRVYVTRQFTQTVSVIDTATNTVVGSPIPGLGSGSFDVAIGTLCGSTRISNSPLRRPGH